MAKMSKDKIKEKMAKGKDKAAVKDAVKRGLPSSGRRLPPHKKGDARKVADVSDTKGKRSREKRLEGRAL